MTLSHFNNLHPTLIVKNLLLGASLVALSTTLPISAYAQTDDEEDEIVVTGIRNSIETSQEIKRNADTFVDSITASDIGALPDRSVLEAVQRVPGVSINRFAGGSDPDHFSVEGSGLVIRGLTFTRSEFNGRDTFSANNGRSLGFEDVPPELVGGVDVFKNQTADMVEGGISGIVNLRTLKPFDRAENVIAGTIDATYSDYRDKISPSVSGLISQRWDTKGGELGLLISGAYSTLDSRSSGFRIGPVYPYAAGADGSFSGYGGGAAADTIAAPSSVSLQDQVFERERLGLSVAGQWASNDGKHLATAEFIRSDSQRTWTEHTLQGEESPGERAGNFSVGAVTTIPFTSGGLLQTRDNTSRVPVSGGLFESGIITNNQNNWTGREGIRMTAFTRQFADDNVTSDYSFNYKYTPNDDWKFNFDAQYVDSTKENLDISIFGSNFLDIALQNIWSNNPVAEFTRNPNDTAVSWDGANPGNEPPDANAPFSQAAFTDPRTQFWRAAMDHFEDSEGDELALRADVERAIPGDSWFESVRVGARFSERDQTTRWTEYNWQNLSEAWNGGYRSFGMTPDQSSFEVFSFADFRNPGQLVGQTEFLFPAVSLVSDYQTWLDFVTQDYFQSSQQNGLAGRGSSTDGLIGGAPQNGLFYDSEISQVSEQNKSAYIRVDFASNDTGPMSVQGNFGVRLIEYDVESIGSLDFQDVRSGLQGNQLTFLETNAPDLLALFDTAANERTISNDETYVLPSFNLKVNFTDDLLARFAIAKAISYPDIGSLRAYRQFQPGFTFTPVGGGPGTPVTGFSTAPVVVGGNPSLKPIQALNIDASLEYYFSDAGSFTASFFYKDLEDVIVNGSEVGETLTTTTGRPVAFEFLGPINGADGKVKGFELAYQDFFDFDFIPAWAEGFGVQANYTYVDVDALPNGGARSEGAIARDETRFTTDDLENLSKHTVNLVGLYENHNIEARLAYNWRSDYLLTAVDVITRLPVYNESTGQLDASFKYQVSDNFKVGVQGVNLLSEVTETSVQIDDDGQRLPRAYFENDRRISLIGSFTF